MLLKRILAGVLCAVILAGGIYYGVTFRFFDRALSAEAQEEFQQKISLPGNFTLTASADCAEAPKNTMQAVRQAVRSGAYALELNVAFDEQNVPYLADGPEYITEDSVTLESVLQANTDYPAMRYVLNLTHIAPPDKLREIIRQNKLSTRVILFGFTFETAREHLNEYAEFLRGVDVHGTDADLQNEDVCGGLIADCIASGVAYLRCSVQDATQELSRATLSGTVRLCINKVHTDYDMYYALSLNPRVAITDRPADMYQLLYSNEYLRLEMENPF